MNEDQRSSLPKRKAQLDLAVVAAFFNSFLRENSTFTWQGDQLIGIPLAANKGLLVGMSWRS